MLVQPHTHPESVLDASLLNLFAGTVIQRAISPPIPVISIRVRQRSTATLPKQQSPASYIQPESKVTGEIS